MSYIVVILSVLRKTFILTSTQCYQQPIHKIKDLIFSQMNLPISSIVLKKDFVLIVVFFQKLLYYVGLRNGGNFYRSNLCIKGSTI